MTDLQLHDIITESINKFCIKEVYNQLTLPFDKKYHNVNGQNIPVKRNYEYFLDWMEANGQYGKLESKLKNFSTEDMRRGCYEVIDNDVLYDLMSSSHESEEDVEMFTEVLLTCSDSQNNFTIPLDEVDMTISSFSFHGNYEDWIEELPLTEIGKENIINKLKEYFIDEVNFNDYNIQNGMVYVERMISLPNLQMTSSFDKDGMDYYTYLNNKFKHNIGVCWSYAKDGACVYDGTSSCDVLLKGWVRAEDLDYYNILYYSNWCCRDEEELRLESGTLVEIDSVEWVSTWGESNDGKKAIRLPLKGSIIMKA